MFSKANRQAAENGKNAKADAAGDRSVPSIISADLTITGDLASAGEIQIDGRVEGDIRCVTLIIGISGSVTGEIRAERLRMHGSVNGQVNAKSVFLASTARMTGDIVHESLAIEPGAYMEGHCRRLPVPAEVVVADSSANKRLEKIDGAALTVAS